MINFNDNIELCYMLSSNSMLSLRGRIIITNYSLAYFNHLVPKF